MNNNFSAFVFDLKSLYIVRVSSSKKTIANAFSENYPEGVIVNGQIAKPDELTKFLVLAVKKARIRDKSIGIIVPEAQTFIKVLQLPVSSNSDLDEAVRWQMRDYLPNNGEGMIVDWRINTRTQNSVSVMVVAAKRELINSYVKAAVGAGLLPVVVETPAIALERLIPRTESCVLTVFVTSSESYILAIEDARILGSSVIPSSDQSAISSDIARIMAHIGRKTTKLYVGGEKMTTEMAQALARNTGIPVETITTPITNASALDIQKYLLGISLTKKLPNAPTSEVTINLLPEELAKNFQKQILTIRLWAMTLTASIIVWSTFIAVFFAFIILSNKKQTEQDQLTKDDTSVFTKAVSEVNSTNQTISKVLAIEGSVKQPFEVINKINSLVKNNLEITDYSVNTETGAVEISGNASASAELLSFKDSLTQEASFSAVTLPLSNLLNDNNTKFNIQFIYTPYAPAVKMVPTLHNTK